MKVDLTGKITKLDGDTDKLELSRTQTKEGRIVSQQRDMKLQDVYFTATGDSCLTDMSMVALYRALTAKVKTEKAFEASDEEFEHLFRLFKLQRFYIFTSFLDMVEELNEGFNIASYGAIE